MHVRWNEDIGAEAWYIGDQIVTRAWGLAQHGWEGEYPTAPPRLEDVHPACIDPVARTRVMDSSGIRAALLYPNIAGLAFDPFVKYPEPEIALAHVRAYNDFLIEFCHEAPGRFVPLAVIPYWDLKEAVAEVERAAALGHHGVVTTGTPQSHGQPFLSDSHWDPLWAVCQETRMAVNIHAANGADDVLDRVSPERMRVMGGDTTAALASTDLLLTNAFQVNDFLTTGVLARFPDMRVVSVESGLGWVPFLLGTSDYHFKRYRVDREHPEFGDLLPSDVFRRQVYVTFWFEDVDADLVAAIGEDNILFETDFPHPTCIYGEEVAEATGPRLASLSEATRAKLLWENAEKLYRLHPAPTGQAT